MFCIFLCLDILKLGSLRAPPSIIRHLLLTRCLCLFWLRTVYFRCLTLLWNVAKNSTRIICSLYKHTAAANNYCGWAPEIPSMQHNEALIPKSFREPQDKFKMVLFPPKSELVSYCTVMRTILLKENIRSYSEYNKKPVRDQFLTCWIVF